MKKLLCILFVMFTLQSIGQTLRPRVEMSYFIKNYKLAQTQYSPIYGDMAFPPQDYGNFRFKSGIVFEYKNFSISNDATIYADKTDFKRTSFEPRLAIWDFEASYHVTTKLKISFFHQCVHKISNYKQYTGGLYGGGEGFSISYGY